MQKNRCNYREHSAHVNCPPRELMITEATHRENDFRENISSHSARRNSLNNKNPNGSENNAHAIEKVDKNNVRARRNESFFIRLGNCNYFNSVMV